MESIILDQNFNKRINLVRASKSKRFANYVIDKIVSSMIAYLLFYVVDVIFFDPEAIVLGQPTFFIMYYKAIKLIIYFVLIVFYYIVTENFLNGKSIAKFITNTKVLNSDGRKPHLDNIVKRSFCRIVPFNTLSFLGKEDSGWHDNWSATIVIDEKLSVFLKNLSSNSNSRFTSTHGIIVKAGYIGSF